MKLWCPVCEPNADPKYLTPDYCVDHKPDVRGVDDRLVPGPERFLSGAGEADGRDCRLMAEVLRSARSSGTEARGARARRGTPPRS
jgi:hypothetical protein